VTGRSVERIHRLAVTDPFETLKDPEAAVKASFTDDRHGNLRDVLWNAADCVCSVAFSGVLSHSAEQGRIYTIHMSMNSQR
jgi:hypothetical protein